MFRKALRRKRVRNYPKPRYPVMEAGDVLSVPKELGFAAAARDLARPLMPVVLSASLAAADASAAPGPGPSPTGIVRSISPLPAVSSSIAAAQDRPYRIRRFTQAEIQELIRDLRIAYTYPENVRGKVALRTPPLTESQGRLILERFFAKNGLRFHEGRRINKEGVDFIVDGYDPERRIGYEFIPIAGEKDLTAAELARLARGISGEHILLVRDERRGLPNPHGVILRLQQAASTFLEKLYRDHVLGRAREIEAQIRALLTGDAQARSAAGQALVRIGPEALWRLLRIGDKNVTGPIIRSIVATHIRPQLEALGSRRLADRDDATRRLIDFGSVVKPYVEERLRNAEGDPEVESRCRRILAAIRE